VNVQVSPNELLVGAPASYGSVFNNTSRWELPMNHYIADPDTFYVKFATKTITSDACGSLTTPYGIHPSVMRQHEYLITVDSIYFKTGGVILFAMEFMRDTLNNYMFITNGLGYPVCTVHADKTNTVKDVEYYSGPYNGIDNKNIIEKQVVIYPNPSDGTMTIEIPTGNNKENNHVFIFNSVGSLVWQKSTPDSLINIDISSISKGIYFVQVSNSKKIFTEKIILQ